MTELELAQSQIVALTTSNVLLRGELVALREKLAALRREHTEPSYLDDYDRTQAEMDAAEKGEHNADCERDGF